MMSGQTHTTVSGSKMETCGECRATLACQDSVVVPWTKPPQRQTVWSWTF